jgi:membrane protease YdiL (CAAX protease family)
VSNTENHPSREGFALTSLIFGIIALVSWRWTLVGTSVAVMSVGFGFVALQSKRRLMADIGIFFGMVGLILSLVTAFHF